jgi:predicted DNA-binding transcriptional regulator YafY
MKSKSQSLRKRFEEMERLLPPPGGVGISASNMWERLKSRGYDVDLRTVQRDLKTLEYERRAQSDGRKPAGWRRATPLARKLDTRSDSVAVALMVLQRHAAHLLPPSVLKELKPHIDEARRAFLHRPQASLARWAERVAVIPRLQPLIPPKVSPAVLETVLEALANGQVLEVRYRALGKDQEKTHRLHPAGLVAREGQFTLVAFHDRSNVPYQFVLHRMRQAVATHDRAQVPSDFDFTAYAWSAEMGFGTGKLIRLEAVFDEDTGWIFEDSKLAPDQTCERRTLKDGSVRYHVTATLEDSKRLDWFLNSFGDGLIRSKKTVLGEAPPVTARRRRPQR